MSSFLGFGGSAAPAGAPAGGEASALATQLKESISAELNTAYAQTLVNSLTENCFEKCVFEPSNSMTSVERQCIDDCASKFMSSWNVLSKSYIARINQK